MMNYLKKIMITAAMVFSLCIPIFADELSTTLTFTVYENDVTYANQTWNLNASSSAQTKTLNEATNAQGTVTYTLQSQKQGSTTVNYFSFNTSTRVLTAAANTPVGTYTVVVRASAAGNTDHIAGTADSTVTVTVSKITVTPTAPTLTTGTLTYNGSAKTLANAGSCTTGGTMYYYVSTSSTAPSFSTSTWKTSIDTATNAGTYYVYWYCYVSNTTTYTGSNINTVKSLGSRTIGKATPTLTLSATSGTLTYPTAATFTVTANTSGGSLSVSSDSTSAATASISSTTVTVTPAAITSDGQTSTITVTSAATTNYNQATATYTATVNRGTMTLTPTAYSGTYNGSGHSASIKSSVAGTTISYGTSTSYGNSVSATNANTNYTMSSVSRTAVGTTTVYYKGTVAGYKDVTGSTTITISKASNPISVTATQSGSITFQTSAKDVNFTAASSGQGSVTYAIQSAVNSSSTDYKSSFSIPTSSTATFRAAASLPVGTYTVVIRATAAGNDNYNSGYKDITYTLTVNKADSTATAPTAKTGLTYTGSDQALANAGSASGGTIYYGIGSSTTSAPTTWTATVPTGTNATTYYVWYKVTGDSNHNNVSATYAATATISQRAVTVTAPTANSSTLTYDGTAKTLASAGACTAGGTMYYYVSTDSAAPAFSTSTWKTTIDQKTDAGTYYIYYYCYVSDTNNNKSASSGNAINTAYSVSKTINRASAGAKPTSTSVSKVYTGSSQNNGYTTPTNVTMTGNNSGTTVGSYEATYTPDSNYAWSDGTTASVKVTLNITNATITVTANNQSYPYDGSSHGSAISVSTVGSQTATIKYGTTEGTYDLTSAPTITNVSDSKTIYYQVTAANHATATGSYYLQISKSAPSVTAPTAANKIYNGSAQTIANAGTVSGGTIYYGKGSSTTTAPTSWSTDLPTGKTVGSYYIWYKVTGDSNHSSVDATYAATATIAKRTVTPTAPTLVSGTLTYNGSAQALAAEGSCTAGGEMYYYVGTNSTAPDFSVATWSKDEIPTMTDAGTYYIFWYCQVTDTNNNNDTSSDKINAVQSLGSKAIVNASVGAKPTTSVSKVFNGSSQDNGYTTPAHVTVSGNRAGTNVGTYTATYTPAANYAWSDGTTSEVTVILTITAAEITVSAPNQSYTYNGDAQGEAITATTVGSRTAMIKYGTTEGTYNTTIVPQITNVSESKTIYYQVSASNHETKTGSYTLTITKANGSVATAPTGKSLTYNGSAQALVNAGVTSTGTMMYRIGTSGDFSSDLPTETNTGSYAIYYYSKGDGNHNDSAVAGPVNATISQRTVKVTAPTASYFTLTYDGTAKTLVSSAGSAGAGGTMYYYVSTNSTAPSFSTSTWKTSIDTPTDTGTYYIYYYCYVSDTANNTSTATGDQINTAYSITKEIINATLTVNAPNQSYVYNDATGNNGTAQGAAITVTTKGSQTATIRYRTASSGEYNLTSHPTRTDVGTTTVYYQVSAANHDTLTGSYTLEITKANGAITAPTAKTGLVYTGSAQTLINAGSSSTGTIKYGLSSSSYSTSPPTGTNAGTYTVYYKVEGDSNHYGVDEDSITVTIGKASVGAKPGTAISKVYTGSVQDNGYTKPDGVTKTGYDSGTAVNTYIATYTPDSNHQWSDGTSVAVSRTLTITKAVITITANNQSYVYDGQEHGAAISATTVDGLTPTIKYGETDGTYDLYQPVKLTNVGTKTVYYQVTANNHETVTGSYTLAITKAAGSVTAPTAKEGLKYNGSALVLINAGSSTTGTIKYRLGTTGTYSETLPSASAVGPYTVYYKVEGDANHEDVAEAYITASIAKGINTINYGDDAQQTWAFSYSSQSVSKELAEAKGVIGALIYMIQSQPEGNYFSLSGNTLTAKANIPVGQYQVTVRANAAGNDNYEEGHADSTVTVNVQGRQNITIPTEVTIGETAAITYDVLGYDLDISVESENDFHLIYDDDSVAYTMTTAWSDLTGTGTLDMGFEVTEEANYAENYTDYLTFNIAYTLIQ